tara:strand:+ start:10058 stop:10444 length:387 start_codon:yes stop_codon:yes gene_type:complete
MGNFLSKNVNKIDPINLQSFINNKNYILINTLSESEQDCLIKNTINASNEVEIINNYIQNNKNINIVIYGKNSHDEKIAKKYSQLKSIGFTNLYLYIGGLFEWLLLQEIYGNAEFETTSKTYDILKYK